MTMNLECHSSGGQAQRTASTKTSSLIEKNVNAGKLSLYSCLALLPFRDLRAHQLTDGWVSCDLLELLGQRSVIICLSPFLSWPVWHFTGSDSKCQAIICKGECCQAMALLPLTDTFSCLRHYFSSIFNIFLVISFHKQVWCVYNIKVSLKWNWKLSTGLKWVILHFLQYVSEFCVGGQWGPAS